MPGAHRRFDFSLLAEDERLSSFFFPAHLSRRIRLADPYRPDPPDCLRTAAVGNCRLLATLVAAARGCRAAFLEKDCALGSCDLDSDGAGYSGRALRERA